MYRFGAVCRRGTRLLLVGTLLVAATAAQANCLGYAYWRPQYATIAENVLVTPGSRVVRRTAPIVRTVTERVLVQPERRLSRVVQAVYRTLTERVVAKPGMTVTRYIPPIQDVVRAKAPGAKGGLVELRPAQKVVDTTPPTYATRSRAVLAQPARMQVQVVPAVYAIRTRRVEVSPARVFTETQPAQYRTVTRRVLVRPAVGPLLTEGPEYCPQLVVAAPVVWYYPAQW